MPDSARFIILDDHPAMLEGLRSILEGEGDLVCAGSASSVVAGRELIRSARYDLMVTDIRFPDGNGFDLAELSRRLHPDRRILFMSMYVSFDYILKALQSGAHGFLSKDSAASALKQGADQLLAGDYFLDPAALNEVLSTITRSTTTSFIGEEEPYHLLTSREREIFDALARGRSTKEVARSFGISPKTVLNHRQNILYKLQLENDTAIGEYAGQLGLLPAQE